MPRITVLFDREAFGGIADAWDKLALVQPTPQPYLQWRWLDSFWSEMPLSGWKVVVLAAWEGDELVGGAPILVRTRYLLGLRHQEVKGLENLHTGIYDWLLPTEPERARIVAGGLIQKLNQLTSGPCILWLRGLHIESSATSVLSSVLVEEGYRVLWRQWRQSPVIRIPDSPGELPSSMSKSKRATLRNRWNRLAKMGVVRFEEVSQSSHLQSHLQAVWKLEAKTWKGKQGNAVAQDPHLENFYRNLAIKLRDAGKVALFLLWCGETLVAFQYCILGEETIYLIKLSIDHQFARTSPNALITWKAIEWAQERGLRTYDLGGESDEWKLRWADSTYDVATLYMFPKGIGGGLLYFMHLGWKDVFKRIPGSKRVKKTVDKFKAHFPRVSTEER